LFAAFFGSIFSSEGSGSGMSVVVSDLDQTAVSEQFVQSMEDLSELNVMRAPEDQARELTRKGKKVAFIILPAGFGADYGSLFSGNTPEVIIGVDPSRKAESGMLQGVMMKLGIQRFENALGSTEALSTQLDQSIAALKKNSGVPDQWQTLLSQFLPQMKELIDQPDSSQSTEGAQGMSSALMPLSLVEEAVVVSRDGPSSAYAVTMPQAMYWAIMGVVMGFGVALVQEKAKGTMGRLVVAPISRVQILGGKALGCFLALVVVVGLFFVLARVLFNVPVDRPDKVLLAVLSVSTAFVGIMMLLAALGKTERGMSSLGWGVMMVFAMFGGAMIPLFTMPAWMVIISDFSPVKWAILMFEGATWRHFSYSEMFLPCLIMVVLGVILFLAGARMLKLEE
jgi:ABC-2 type transport system permease protein